MSLSNKLNRRPDSGSRADFTSQWHRVFRSNPPLRIGIALLRSVIVQAQQESIRSSIFRALEKQLASCLEPPSVDAPTKSKLRIGDRVVRGWGGTKHEVTVLPKGYSYRGTAYQSLSEIARLITGTRWSGPRFFGTRERSL
jgi:Protein of unknown function (DUF2924)